VLAAGSLIPWLAYAIYAYWALIVAVPSAWEFIFIGFTFAYPFIVIVSAIMAWKLYRAHKDRWALFFTSLFQVGPMFYLVTICVTTLPK
jgi:hypothetical protein